MKVSARSLIVDGIDVDCAWSPCYSPIMLEPTSIASMHGYMGYDTWCNACRVALDSALYANALVGLIVVSMSTWCMCYGFFCGGAFPCHVARGALAMAAVHTRHTSTELWRAVQVDSTSHLHVFMMRIHIVLCGGLYVFSMSPTCSYVWCYLFCEDAKKKLWGGV